MQCEILFYKLYMVCAIEQMVWDCMGLLWNVTSMTIICKCMHNINYSHPATWGMQFGDENWLINWLI